MFEKFKNDETAFLFLDPPYMFWDNSGYERTFMVDKKDKKDFVNNRYDTTKIIIDIYEYFKIAKCKIMLIINKLYFIEWLFNGYIKGSYIKTYQLGKKKETLLIITNF